MPRDQRRPLPCEDAIQVVLPADCSDHVCLVSGLRLTLQVSGHISDPGKSGSGSIGHGKKILPDRTRDRVNIQPARARGAPSMSKQEKNHGQVHRTESPKLFVDPLKILRGPPARPASPESAARRTWLHGNKPSPQVSGCRGKNPNHYAAYDLLSQTFRMSRKS